MGLHRSLTLEEPYSAGRCQLAWGRGGPWWAHLLLLLSFSLSVASDNEFRAGAWPSATHGATHLTHSSGTS